jgi:hypothetical protein
MRKVGWVFVAAMLFTGSINTLSKKLMNESRAKNMDGDKILFKKPWYEVLWFFLVTSCNKVAFVDKLWPVV